MYKVYVDDVEHRETMESNNIV